MKTYSNLLTESKKDKVVFVFGRMNPPTIGHEKVIDTIKSIAKRNRADYAIFLSQSHDSSKNPLTPEVKKRYFEKMFHNKLNDSLKVSPVKTPLEAAVQLYNMGYKNIIFVGGSDRKSMGDLLKKYNDVQSNHGYYKFNSIEFMSAGDRDPDAEGTTGMSASKVREFVKSGDFKNFEKAIPNLSPKEKKDFFNILRRSMKFDIIRESIKTKPKSLIVESVKSDTCNRNYLGYFTQNFQQFPKINNLFNEIDNITLNDRKCKTYFVEAVKNIDLILEDIETVSTGDRLLNADNLLYDIEKFYNCDRGFLFDRTSLNELTEHIENFKKNQIEVSQMKTFKSFLSKIEEECWPGYKQVGMKKKGKKMVPNCVKEGKEEVPQDPDVEDKDGTQPAKYFKGLSKSTKEKRDAHFKQGKAKHWDDSSAYKPAPGDDVETKESKYTKAMKKKFPSLYKEENIKERSDSGLVRQAKDDAEISAYRKKTMQNDLETERAKIEKMKLDREKLATVRNNVKFQKGIKETLELDEGKADSSIAKKAEKSGISAGILRQVYNRGVAAWRTGHRPGTTPEQWGHARVNSFISGGKTRTTADADLWKKHKGNK